MSAGLSLLPAASRRDDAASRTRSTPLDVVHDHVLRLVGDAATAHAVLVDVVVRANARRTELGEAPTLTSLLRHAHARIVHEPLREGHVDGLAPAGDPAARAVVHAMRAPSRRAVAILDLTTRHGLDLRTVADVLGMDRTHAARARTEALHQVRAAVAAAGGSGIDVEAAIGDLPVVPADSTVHDLLDRSAPSPRMSPRLAWVTPVLATVGLAAAILVGIPKVVAAENGDVPVVAAEGVSEGPAVQQLRAPTTGLPADEIDQLVVRPTSPSQDDAPSDDEVTEEAALEPAASPAPEASPTPEPTPSPTPSDEPDTESSPTPEPSEDPLGQLLPTGP